MYAEGNPKTKKELKLRVLSTVAFDSETGKPVFAGEPVRVFSPGPFPCPQNGRVSLEGPHYPEPHRWYANVEVVDGCVVKVLS